MSSNVNECKPLDTGKWTMPSIMAGVNTKVAGAHYHTQLLDEKTKQGSVIRGKITILNGRCLWLNDETARRDMGLNDHTDVVLTWMLPTQFCPRYLVRMESPHFQCENQLLDSTLTRHHEKIIPRTWAMFT